ncbi:hypothetical protein CBM2599_B50500 [Cupriavidus taiwanensis]|nr:hypothetical protein CBM2599_B50500 [Cupriavidus taiwanensis]
MQSGCCRNVGCLAMQGEKCHRCKGYRPGNRKV